LDATLIRETSLDREVPVVIHLAPLELGGQKCVGLVMKRDASDLKSDEYRLDPLTQLPDRSQLFDRLTTLMSGDRAYDQNFAALFIDLDDFKQVNDCHGHLNGDRVLKEVARRLVDCVRAEDMVVRFGGDEFVALIEHASGWDRFDPVIERVRDALSEPIVLPTRDIFVSASIGVAEFSSEHRVPEDLIADADRAMYAAKRRRFLVAV
jgi:diguanylate cyclase (GGDEF)-like protein